MFCHIVERLARIQLSFFVVASILLLWLCNQSSADNTGMFQVGIAYTGGRPFLLVLLPFQAGIEVIGRGQLGQFTPTDQ